MSVDGKSHKSEHTEYEIPLRKKATEAPRKVIKNEKFNQSMEYGRH